MQTFEIKNRWNGQVLFSAGGETLCDVVVQAARKRAHLSDADLSGAYLSGAYLSGANGKKLTLVGPRPVFIIGPIGSRCDYMTAYLTDAGVYVRAGCFFDGLSAFRDAVIAEHNDRDHGREYMAAIPMIEAHASIWTPVVKVAEAA
jgi:hypothetical protein